MTERSVSIELDKVRHLRYTANDVADIEEALDMGLPQIFQLRNISVRVVRALLWGGLKGEDPALRSRPAGLMAVGDLVEAWFRNGGDLMTLFDKCAQGFKAAGWFGSGEGETKPENKEVTPSKNSRKTG